MSQDNLIKSLDNLFPLIKKYVHYSDLEDNLTQYVITIIKSEITFKKMTTVDILTENK